VGVGGKGVGSRGEASKAANKFREIALSANAPGNRPRLDRGYRLPLRTPLRNDRPRVSMPRSFPLSSGTRCTPRARDLDIDRVARDWRREEGSDRRTPECVRERRHRSSRWLNAIRAAIALYALPRVTPRFRAEFRAARLREELPPS